MFPEKKKNIYVEMSLEIECRSEEV